jgi:hypothetical protein
LDYYGHIKTIFLKPSKEIKQLTLELHLREIRREKIFTIQKKNREKTKHVDSIYYYNHLTIKHNHIGL